MEGNSFASGEWEIEFVRRSRKRGEGEVNVSQTISQTVVSQFGT